MDDRLKEVRRTEQTESRINEDFVAWLKTSGMTWLVMLLVVLVAYFLLVRWRDSQTTHQNNAWIEYEQSRTTGLPSRYLSVADQYGNVDSVGLLARLKAGRRWLQAVQAGQPLDAEPESDVRLSPEDRAHYLSRADETFRAVIDLAKDNPNFALHIINALNGRAAVAEAHGQFEEAKGFYEQAAARAGDIFPHLADQARERAGSVMEISQAPSLPSASELAALEREAEPLHPVDVDDAFRDLLTPDS